jgi:hypothetical protein
MVQEGRIKILTTGFNITTKAMATEDSMKRLFIGYINYQYCYSLQIRYSIITALKS